MPALADGLGGLIGALFGAAVAFAIPFRAGPAVPSPTTSPAPTGSRVICTRHVSTAPRASDDCAEMQTRLDWCNGRLRAATRVRPTTAPPETVGVDDPADWDRRLRDVLATCHIPATVTTTDCTEYPCVSALRAPDDNQMNGLLDRCDAAHFTEKDLAALLPFPVVCPDGHTETLWMIALADNPTLDELYGDGEHGVDFDQLALLGARRAEALARGWTCE